LAIHLLNRSAVFDAAMRLVLDRGDYGCPEVYRAGTAAISTTVGFGATAARHCAGNCVFNSGRRQGMGQQTASRSAGVPASRAVMHLACSKSANVPGVFWAENTAETRGELELQ
jgi:hypothetical protein